MVLPEATGHRCRLHRRAGVETVRVRIGVRIEGDGGWHSSGSLGWDDRTNLEQLQDYNGHPPETVLIHWLEADLPVPVSETVEGVVS
jgi:hypothetical protein